MALLWYEGFENCVNNSSSRLIDNHSEYFDTFDQGSGGPRPQGGIGRRSTWGCNFHNNIYWGRWNLKNVSSNEMIVGFAMKRVQAGTPAANTSYPLLRVYDSKIAGNVHLNICVDANNNFAVYRNTTLLGTSSGLQEEYNIWRYFEVKFKINATTGYVIIHYNEQEILNLTSINTMTGSNAYARGYLFDMINPYTWVMDDLYFCDVSGAKNNDFLGDSRIDVLRPNAAGIYTDFTPGAGANYQNVDEQTHDSDATYNDGANVGDQDSYQMPDLPTPAGTTIYGVKTQATVRKTDAGAMKCKLLTRAGTTDDLGDEIILSDSYTTHAKILENNPDDLAAWQDADVNGMEVGVEITA